MYYCKGMILCMLHCHVLYSLLQIKLLLTILEPQLHVLINEWNNLPLNKKTSRIVLGCQKHPKLDIIIRHGIL